MMIISIKRPYTFLLYLKQDLTMIISIKRPYTFLLYLIQDLTMIISIKRPYTFLLLASITLKILEYLYILKADYKSLFKWGRGREVNTSD